MSTVATVTEVPQHMKALARANEIRWGHAALKREVREGALSVLEALDDPRARGALTVAALLDAQERWGRRRVVRLLTPLHISEARRVDQLTERQRAALRAAL